MSNILSLIGIVLSAIYSYFVYRLVSGRLDTLDKIPLNELGDFFAGIFGPLAILWLVLGFLQQGSELRQNTKALELQAEELRNSVSQQEQLVDISWRQHEINIESLKEEKERLIKLSEPRFVVAGYEHKIDDGYLLIGHFQNIGATATQVSAKFTAANSTSQINTVHLWEKQKTHQLAAKFSEQELPQELNLIITCTNELGYEFTQAFNAVKSTNERGSEVYAEWKNS